MLRPYSHIRDALTVDILHNSPSLPGLDEQNRVKVKVVANKAFTRKQDTSVDRWGGKDRGPSLRYRKNELVGFEFVINQEVL